MLGELALRSKAWWGYDDDFIASCRDELLRSPGPMSSFDQVSFVAFSEVANEQELVLGFHSIARLSSRAFDLAALFVEPDWIGNGVGRRLIEHAKRTAEVLGADRLRIESDPHSVDFYRAAGAVVIGEAPSASLSGRSLPLLEIDLTQLRFAA